MSLLLRWAKPEQNTLRPTEHQVETRGKLAYGANVEKAQPHNEFPQPPQLRTSPTSLARKTWHRTKAPTEHTPTGVLFERRPSAGCLSVQPRPRAAAPAAPVPT